MSYKPLTEENCKDFPNFKYSEFKCKCKGKYCNGYPVPFSYELAKNLQKIRTHFGKPLHINSAIRCEQHNKNVGGVTRSKHKLGWAVDYYISGVSYDDLNKYVRTLPYFNYCYKIHKTKNTMHYDIKPPAYSIVVQPVNRDENKDQIKVLAKKLNVREDATTKANSVGYATTNAIYNYYDVRRNENYDWFKIADKQWVANNGKYLDVYTKPEPKPIPKPEPKPDPIPDKVDELNKKIEELNNTINELNKDIQDLEFRNKALKSENEVLKEKLEDDMNFKFKYIAKESEYHRIYLNEKEELYIK